MLSLSISDLLPFMDCELKGAIRLLRQRWVGSTGKMQLGTELHAYAAGLLKGYVPERPTIDFPDLDEICDGIDVAVGELLRTWEVVAVERAIAMPLSKRWGVDVELLMRPDGILQHRSTARAATLQWKSVGKGRNISLLAESVRLSPHEISYRLGAPVLLPPNVLVDATVLGIIRTELSQKEKRDGTPRVTLMELPCMSLAEAALFESSVLPYVKKIVLGRARGVWSMNFSACVRQNMVCPLFNYCHYSSDLQDCLPVPLEDRYQDVFRPGAAAGGTPPPTSDPQAEPRDVSF